MGYSLFRIERVWHYRFQMGGTRIQRSTHETVKARAEEVADKAYRLERLATRGEEPVPTLQELVQKWISVNSATASKGHVRTVEIFCRLHLYDLGGTRIDRFRTDMVDATRNRHLEHHAPATANHWLRILKLLFGWAVRRNLISSIPWRVTMLKLQKQPRVILPVAKASAWLAAVDVAAGARTGIRTAIRLMLGLGLRESEALSSRWEWIDWERSIYTPGITKGREAQPLPMAGWLVEHLEPLKVVQGLIVSSPRGGSYSPGATRAVIIKANAAIDIVGLTPHRLRGTYATLLSESGVPVQDIKRVMRHKDLATTLGYLEMDLSRATKAQEQIARRMGFTFRGDTAGNP